MLNNLIFRFVMALILVGGIFPMFTTGKAVGVDGPIIANHTIVNDYSIIPQKYIDLVKKMYLNVPGESHSAGYRIGLELLKQLDSRFKVINAEGGPPTPYTDQALRVDRYVYNNTRPENATGEQEWYTWHAWADPSDAPGNNENLIKEHITYCNTHGLTIAAIGFGWCYDMVYPGVGGGLDTFYNVHWGGESKDGPDGNKIWGLSDTLSDNDTALTGNRVNMDDYLAATEEYISLAQSYGTVVFFTTGPVDTYGGENGVQREIKHNYIRQYVNDHNKVLFDYADILAYNDAGEENILSWTDPDGNAHEYQFIHPDNMKDLNGSYTEDGDHIGERGALRLGKAMWWLLARLAGWDGNPESEIISITITDSGAAGVNFGSLDPGTTNSLDAGANDTTPSIIVNVEPESIVHVDLQIKGTDFGPGFAVTNAKYSTTYDGTKNAMSTTYTTFDSDVAPGSSANLWHWLNVPSSGVTASAYSSTFSYQAIVHQ